MGWVGIIESRQGDRITLRDARPFHAGLCTGSSDLIGWTPVTVTPEMVGRKVAVFTAVEVKGEKGKIRPEQARFNAAVNEAGGVALFAFQEGAIDNLFKVIQDRCATDVQTP
ncbi:MAG TPA: VRR-NUC domain-containing protein [Bryobacteraceae bacterium]|nr:VRR-NUC domain-containing protein [Bryobacteraceae bacterium]